MWDDVCRVMAGPQILICIAHDQGVRDQVSRVASFWFVASCLLLCAYMAFLL